MQGIPTPLAIGRPVPGATAGSILYAGAGGILAQDNANLKWGTTAGQGLTANAGTATTAVSPLALTQTWNASGVTFPGFTVTITDTASAAASLVAQFLGGAAGATSLFKVDKAGVLTALTITATTKFLMPDGTVGTPSIGFASDDDGTGTGIYRAGTNQMHFVANGVSQASVSSSGFSVGSGNDAFLVRDATDIIAQKRANSAQEFRVYAGNGGFLSNVKSVTESLTIAAAPTTVGATSIPAGAILLGVSVRVTTVIPTAATFTYATTVGATALNTAAVSTAANSTDPGTAAGASYRAAATTITITPNLTPGAATGVVRLQYYYLQATPPTS